MATVKENVKAFYKKAKEENWYQFYIYPNELKLYENVYGYIYYQSREDCPLGSIESFTNGTILEYYSLCSEMPEVQRSFITGLGFSLKDSCFWFTRDPETGWMGHGYCHIQYNGRELTADELWLTDIKQRAIDLGYDIRDCSSDPKCSIGWGVWGATWDEAYNALDGFCTETGVTMSSASLIQNFQGGYLYVIDSFYAYGLYNITEMPEETWKWVSEPYWRYDLKWVIIDYEMQTPDLTPCPEYPTGYCYFYRGEPWIGGECKAVGGGQMYPGYLTGVVYFGGNPGDTVTLKIAKIDRRTLEVVDYPDEVMMTIPEKPTPTTLSIAITDVIGIPITESVVGETIYVTGQLKDSIENVALQGASVLLYRNGVATGETDITDVSGIYSIPYIVTSADIPTVRFKTLFEGT